MTSEESRRLTTLEVSHGKMTEAFVELALDVRELMTHYKTLVDSRQANGVSVVREFEAFESRCLERHGGTIERIEHLERSERRTYGMMHRLQGAVAPAAVFLAGVSLLITFLR